MGHNVSTEGDFLWHFGTVTEYPTVGPQRNDEFLTPHQDLVNLTKVVGEYEQGQDINWTRNRPRTAMPSGAGRGQPRATTAPASLGADSIEIKALMVRTWRGSFDRPLDFL